MSEVPKVNNPKAVRRSAPFRFGTVAAVLVLFICLPGLGEEPAALVAGRAAMQDELYAVAERQLSEFLDREEGTADQNAEAALWLAQALYEQGKFREILDLTKPRRDWVKRAPDPAAFAFWRAVALYKTGETTKSAATVEEIQRDHPTSEYVGHTWRLAAWMEIRSGNMDAASAAFSRFETAVKKPRDLAATLLEWAKALIAAGRADDARDVLDRLIRLPEGFRAVQEGIYWRGQILMDRGDGAAAIPVFQRLAENSKVDADLGGRAFLKLAEAYESLTNYPLAAVAASNGMARAKSPEIQLRGQARLGHLWLRMGREAEGIPLIKRFVAAQPLSDAAPAYQMEIGRALLERGQAAAAVAEFQLYLETFTNRLGRADAHLGKGWALLGCDRYSEAAISFTRAGELFEDPASRGLAAMKAADALLLNGQYEPAAAAYERVEREFPQSDLTPRARLQAAHCLARAGKGEWAELRLIEIDRLHAGTPTGEEALLRLAQLREESGRFKEALEAYGLTLNRYTNGAFSAEARVGRGILQYRQFLTADALKDFDHVIARHPNSESAERALFMKGLCHFRVMQDAEMLGVFRTFQSRYPESRWMPDVMFWLGQFEYNQERFEAAERLFLALTEKYKVSPLVDQALLRAGSAAIKRKEYIRGIELLTRLAKEYPKSRHMVEARFFQAEALSQLGKYADAILVLDEIRNRFPTHSSLPTVWLRRGDCQFMLGSEDSKRYEAALTSYSVVASDPVVAREQPDLVYEAEYKIGKCHEKQDRSREALDQYYSKVMIRFLRERERNIRHTETGKMWFTRAALNAADILEARKDWRRVVNVLERVIDAGVPAGKDTRDRIRKIRNEYYWLFYGD